MGGTFSQHSSEAAKLQEDQKSSGKSFGDYVHDCFVTEPLPESSRKELGFRDIEDEYTNEPCSVSGSIPPYVRGQFYDQCGGAFGTEGHLDGLAHVARWHVSPERCDFTNKFVDSDFYRLWKEMGLRLWEQTGAEKKQSRSSRMKRVAAAAKVNTLNANVAFWRLRSQMVATSEVPEGYAALLDDNCNTVAGVKPLPGGSVTDPEGMVFTTPAHYLESLGDQDYHASLTLKMIKGFPPSFEFGYRIFLGRNEDKFAKVADMVLTTVKYNQLGNVPAHERPSYMHSVCETSKYFIMLGSSVRIDPKKLVAQDNSQGFFGMFNLEPVPIVFHVFAKCDDGSLVKVKDCQADISGHLFHVVNMCDLPNGGLLLDLTYRNDWAWGSRPIRNKESICIMRFRLDLESGTATSERLTARPEEFACVNPRFLGNPDYRYLYGLSFDDDEVKTRLFKFDLQTRVSTPLAVRGASGSLLWASEPQFVPAPRSGTHVLGEEEGVLLCPVVDEDSEKGFLLVLDPKTMTEVARVSSPIDINAGLHNRWVPDAADHDPIMF